MNWEREEADRHTPQPAVGNPFHEHLGCLRPATEEAMSWEKQEAEADRREAVENEAGERAAMHFASPEALKPFLEDLFEEDDLLAEAEAICCMEAALQNSIPEQVAQFEAEALSALKRLTNSVFRQLADDERRKIERDD